MESTPVTAVEVSTWINMTTFNDVNAVPGMQYFYYVKSSAYSESNLPSDFSNGDSGIRRISPPVFTLVSSGTFGDRVELEWTTPFGSLYYQLYRGATSDTTLISPITGWTPDHTFSDNNVEVKTNYIYFVKAASNAVGLPQSFFSQAGQGFANSTITEIKRDLNPYSVYPNPTSGVLNLKIKGASAQHVFIQDIVGSDAEELPVVNNTVDIRSRSSGIYFLRIVTQDAVMLVKIVKE